MRYGWSRPGTLRRTGGGREPGPTRERRAPERGSGRQLERARAIGCPADRAQPTDLGVVAVAECQPPGGDGVHTQESALDVLGLAGRTDAHANCSGRRSARRETPR